TYHHTRSTRFPYTTLFRSVNDQSPLAFDHRQNVTCHPYRWLNILGVAQLPLSFRVAQLCYSTTSKVCVFICWGAHQTKTQTFDRSEEHTSELQSLAYLVCR